MKSVELTGTIELREGQYICRVKEIGQTTVADTMPAALINIGDLVIAHFEAYKQLGRLDDLLHQLTDRSDVAHRARLLVRGPHALEETVRELDF